MSEFPRAQKIAALILITLVVVVTLIAVAVQGSDDATSAAADPIPTEPTVVPVLARPRLQWKSIAEEVRGAQDTRSPVACPFIDEREIEPNNFLSLTPGLTFVCDQRGLQAKPIAPGRVVMRVDQAPLNSVKAELLAGGNDGPWLRAAAYGAFVVIDHGPLNDVSNVTSVYSGLDSLDSDLRVGQAVDVSTPLGTLGARSINDELVPGVLTFELLTDDTRFGRDPLRKSPPPASESPNLAAKAIDHISLPVTTCNVPFGNQSLLVGAIREYRSGVHNGLDFNCFTADHEARAAGEGHVIFVVDDYVDADPEDRDATLAQAASTVGTPFWTLAMLYGNFVVIDHEIGDGRRAISLYAHLAEVDPGIVIGREVTTGTVIGRIGNSGTSAAAEGIFDNDGSVHLHWELHVDDRPIGYLEDPSDTGPLYEQILCTPEEPTTAAGC